MSENCSQQQYSNPKQQIFPEITLVNRFSALQGADGSLGMEGGVGSDVGLETQSGSELPSESLDDRSKAGILGNINLASVGPEASSVSPIADTKVTEEQGKSIEGLIQILILEMKNGFSVSEANQKDIQGRCSALEEKLDNLAA